MDIQQRAGKDIRRRQGMKAYASNRHSSASMALLIRAGHGFYNTIGENQIYPEKQACWKSYSRWKQLSKLRTKAKGLTFLLQERDEKLSDGSTQSLARGSRNHMVTEAANPWEDKILSLTPKLPALAAKSKTNQESPFTFQPLHRQLFFVTTSTCHIHHGPTLQDLCLHFYLGDRHLFTHIKHFNLSANYFLWTVSQEPACGT